MCNTEQGASAKCASVSRRKNAYSLMIAERLCECPGCMSHILYDVRCDECGLNLAWDYCHMLSASS